jgi:hypothetical protein
VRRRGWGCLLVVALDAEELGRVVGRGLEDPVDNALVPDAEEVGDEVVVGVVVGVEGEARRDAGRQLARQGRQLLVGVEAPEAGGRGVARRDAPDLGKAGAPGAAGPGLVLRARRYRGRLAHGSCRAVVLVAARPDVHRRVDGLVLLPVAQHTVLEGEAPAADVAGEGPLARVRAHVSAQVLR